MLSRKIGKRKLELSAVGLGCMGLSQSDPPFPDKQEAVNFLHQAVEMGQTFYDTSELYGMYQNEELLGETFQDCRHNMSLPRNLDGIFVMDRCVGLTVVRLL